VGGLKLNWILEWGGIACVLLGTGGVLKEMEAARRRVSPGQGRSHGQRFSLR
jgi:hypothetical protein